MVKWPIYNRHVAMDNGQSAIGFLAATGPPSEIRNKYDLFIVFVQFMETVGSNDLKRGQVPFS